VKIWCDGSNTEYCFLPEDSEPKIFDNPAGCSHNESEYLAVLGALLHLARWTAPPPFPAEIISDSQLVVRQLNGLMKKMGRTYQEPVYEVKDAGMQVLAHVVEQVLRVTLPYEIKFTWVPREENRAGKILERRKV